MTGLSQLALRTLVTCLTICQLGAIAEAKPHAAPKKKRVKISYSLAQNETSLPMMTPESQSVSADRFESAEEDHSPKFITDDEEAPRPVRVQTVMEKPARSSSPSKSPMFLIPRAGVFGAEVGVNGDNSDVKGTVRDTTTSYKITSVNQGVGVSADGKLGVTDHVYIFTGVRYSQSQTTSTVSSGSFTGDTKSVTTSEGLSEPTIGAGVHGQFGGTQLIGELSGAVPLGAKKSRTTNYDTTTDARSGGGSISPRVALVQQLGKIRLVGALNYTFNLERTTEFDGLSSTKSETVTGGNNLSLVLGTEIPAVWNLGFAAVYSRSEESTTVSKPMLNTSLSTSRTSGASSAIGGAAYLGIPMGGKARLVPRLMYATVLEQASGNTTQIDQTNIWTLGLSTQLLF